MKTDPFLRRFTAPLFLTALTLLTAMPVFAQGDRPATRRQSDAESKRATVASGSLYDIEITDGRFIRKGKDVEATLQNVVDLLRERHDGANIVLSPGLPRIRIANLKLRATTVEQELEALRVASGYKFVWNSGGEQPAIDPMTGVPRGGPPGVIPPPVAVDPNTGLPVRGKENPAELYILSEVPSGLATPGRLVEVFNLTDYFNSLGSPDEDNHQKLVDTSLAQIKEIVTSTLQATDEDHSSAVSFQFHSGANLLVVAGTPDGVEVARKVVNALAPQAKPVGFGAMRADPWGNPYPAPEPGGFMNAFGATPLGSGSRLPAASSKARRAILNKLETIRLDSAGPWDLPLSEIVRLLNDEAKKRDPEKRGINFLINPNQPPIAADIPGMPAFPAATPGQPAAAPAVEAIDINSVQIKIALPLNNVRLIDVLDAMVKVADHPIRYTITDYAVVFSLRGPETAMNETSIPGAPGGYSANSP